MLPQTLTDQEITSVLEQAKRYGLPGDHMKWRALMTVLVNYGPRISECLALSWNQVDFDRSTITFPTLKQWKKINGVRVRKSVTRTLPLIPAVGQILQEYRAMTNGDPRVFPFAKTGRCTAWHAFQKMLKRAGIPQVKLHVLRHTAASRWAEVDVAVAQEVLGHCSIEMTGRYIHARDIRARMQRLPAIT